MTGGVLLGGPLGVGRHVTVKEFPSEDCGVVCLTHKLTAVWDAPLVALELADQVSCALVGNDLGPGVESDAFRRKMTGSGIYVIELMTNDLARQPAFDFVVSSLARSTRTWYSTIQTPSLSTFYETVTQLEVDRAPSLLYLDHWLGDTAPPDLVERLRRLATPIVYYNFGDMQTVDPVLAVSRALVGKRAVFQMSFKGVEFEALTESTPRCLVDSSHVIVVTRGGLDALVCTQVTSRPVPIRFISQRETTGAGAVLSANVISALLRGAETETIAAAIVVACDVVSGRVESSTLDTRFRLEALTGQSAG